MIDYRNEKHNVERHSTRSPERHTPLHACRGVDLPECKYIPLADLTQDRYERDLKVWDSLHILCPELVQSSPDASTLDGNSEGSSISQDSSLEGPSVAQDLKGSRSEGRGKAEIEQGLGPWAEGKQALIRLQKVMGHEQVFLIR